MKMDGRDDKRGRGRASYKELRPTMRRWDGVDWVEPGTIGMLLVYLLGGTTGDTHRQTKGAS